MSKEHFIFQKLAFFIRKFYLNELIKGSIFFIGLGILYFIFTFLIEYFLWFKPFGRLLLFWLFVLIEIFLLIRFIIYPLSRLLQFKKGIDFQQASLIIGNHFPEVGDKLLNFLQLTQSSQQSELLVASIEQKALDLQPIPFSNAIHFSQNKKYLPLLLVPFLIIFLFYGSGNSAIVSESFTRILHYNQTFTPPAPFQFIVLNPSLQTEQNSDFHLKIKVQGKIIPEKVAVHIGNESYFMESSSTGYFDFVFPQVTHSTSFYLKANTVVSSDFTLVLVPKPSITNFDMRFLFPSYINKKPEILKATGNGIVPEGTKVIWYLTTESTDDVFLKAANTSSQFLKTNSQFIFSKTIFQTFDYQIITSNSVSKQSDKLSYKLVVIKDQFPTIQASFAPEKLQLGSNYIVGQVSDDYGLSKLQVVYYPKDNPKKQKKASLPLSSTSFSKFVFRFPGTLAIDEGTTYEYFFEVFDNDALHHFKSSQSSRFSSRIATTEEKENSSLEQQKNSIQGLQKSIKSQDKQNADLDKLKKLGKEKNTFEYKEQLKVSDFLSKQKQAELSMQQFAEKIKETLNNFQANKKDPTKENLEDRLEKAIKESDKNQKLLDELQQLNTKINAEDLMQKLDNFKQQSKNQVKSLAQLLELTKKFYVEKKAQQIADKLDKLSNKQDQLSSSPKENSVEEQKNINESFDKIKNELSDLKKDNSGLKSPLDMPKDNAKENQIQNDLQKALEDLKKDSPSKAQSKQQSAARQMKSLSKQLKEDLASSEQEQLQEDVAMLRQITDNLLAFSTTQEKILKQFKNTKTGAPSFTKNIKIQQNLKQQFKHIDDSLFALSLRNPKIADDITKSVGNVDYNITNAIESLTNSQFNKGVSHQQYVVSEANKLADKLSDILFGMQMSLSGSSNGKPKPGQGQGMQLSDIIKKQEGITEKMKAGLTGSKKQEQGSEKSKGKGNDGEGEAEALMQIVKEQRNLRERLENELNKQGMTNAKQAVLNQMQQLEKQLLNKGFKNESIQKSLGLQQELLKLKNALQEQGQDTQRQSEVNRSQFANPDLALPKPLTDYINSIEILNRQSLPLRPQYNTKVKKYFNNK